MDKNKVVEQYLIIRKQMVDLSQFYKSALALKPVKRRSEMPETEARVSSKKNKNV